MLHAVVMAGGSGTRFWPQSRHAFPKQLQALTGPRTMIQLTLDRVDGMIGADARWVITNEVQATETRRQLPELPSDQLILEPCGRNTAPCIGLMAQLLLKRDSRARMLVMPADHAVPDIPEFQADIQRACNHLDRNKDALVLFGVAPTYPAVGFGYIERSGEKPDANGVSRMVAFHEKPQWEIAQNYLESGVHYWNCGIFVWEAETLLANLAVHAPDISTRLDRLARVIGTPEWDAALQSEFPSMPSISIDYAVLEHSVSVQMIEASFAWDDLGSWNSVARFLAKDPAGNTLSGATCAVDANNCLVMSDDEHLVAIAGVRDLIVVHTKDATMVVDRHDEAAIRRLVQYLAENGYSEYL